MSVLCISCTGAEAHHHVFQALICSPVLSSSTLFQPCLDPWALFSDWTLTQSCINTFLLLLQVRSSGSRPRVPPPAICHCALLFCLILALGSDVENIPVGSLTGTSPPPFLSPTHTRATSDMKIGFSSARVRSPPNMLRKSSSSDWKSAVLNKTCRNAVSCAPGVVSSTMSPQQWIRLSLISSKAIFYQWSWSVL